MNGLLMTLAVSLSATVTPQPGLYDVTVHSAQVTTPEWEGLCGDVPVAMPAPKQVEVKAYDDGKKWWVDGGDAFRLGTHLCFGRNPSLKINGQSEDKKGWQLSCTSERVVKGTETSGHRLIVEGDKITITHVSDAYQFVRRSRCKSKIERTIVLLRAAKQPAVTPAVPAPVKRKSMADIEAELEAEILNATKRQASGGVVISHENRLPGGFVAMEAVYLLDGKPLTTKMDTPLLRPGTKAKIADTVATAGVHVLEVKLTYRLRNAGRNYRVGLKDAVFFDAKANKPTAVTIRTIERGGFLVEKTESAAIEFLVDGKPPAKKNAKDGNKR